MPIKKWLVQYIVLFPLISIFLAGVQYLKGSAVADAMVFGLIWSFISITVFAINRIYYFRNNISCAVCNDLTQDSTDQKQ